MKSLPIYELNAVVKVIIGRFIVEIYGKNEWNMENTYF